MYINIQLHVNLQLVANIYVYVYIELFRKVKMCNLNVIFNVILSLR